MLKATQSQNYVSNKVIAVKPEAQVPYGDNQSDNVSKQMKFLLPQYLGYINPQQTFLKFDLKMTGRGLLKPDERCGAHSLIENVRIQDGTSSATLEEIQNYNMLTGQKWSYTYNESISNKREDYEGQNKSSNHSKQLFHDTPGDWNAAPVTTNPAKRTVECMMSLDTGIFGSNKIFPVVATQGLRLTVDLDNVRNACVLNGAANNAADVTVRNAGMLADTSGLTVNSNFTTKVEIDTALAKAAVNSVSNVDLQDPGASANFTGAVTANVGNNSNPLMIGDLIYIALENGTDEKPLGIIQAFDKDGDGDLRISQIMTRNLGVALGTTYPVGSRVYIKPADRLRVLTTGDYADIPVVNQLFNEALGFRLENVEMVVNQVIPPVEYTNNIMKAIQSSQGLTLDYRTFNTYRHQLASLNGATDQLIAATQTKAYSIISVPTGRGSARSLTASAWRGSYEGGQNYQYIHNGHLIPNRSVDLARLTNTDNAVGQVFVNELEKSLVNCGLVVRNLYDIKDNFFIARGFSKYGQVYNLTQGDLNLRVQYEGATVPKDFFHFIQSRRQINISQNGVMVIN